MAKKFVSFTFTPQGELAYSNTGRLAPSSYSVRGNTVYGADNRKIGNVRKLENLRKSQREKVESASRNRQHRRAQRIRNAGQQKPKRPRKPSQKAGPSEEYHRRDPNVPPSEEYFREYANVIHEYARALHDGWSRNILMNATLEDCEMLHELAYDVYEAFIQYGEDALNGTLTPMQRRSFERVGYRLASLLQAIKGGSYREEMGRNRK